MPSKAADKPILKGLTIAVACPLGAQWSDANISRWVGLRSGVFSSDMTDQVTHLICPVDEYKNKNKNPTVKHAIKLGVRRCKVVSLDWLDDTLLKNKKLPEKPYLLTTLLKGEREKRIREQKEAKGAELADRFVNTNLYRVYSDNTHFFYEVTLTRHDSDNGCEGQRYVLYLFESNAEPRLYHAAVKFYKKFKDNQPNYHRLSETPQTFVTEFEKFKAFFLKKTGIEWDKRLLEITIDDSLFQYKAPAGGKPVGYIPQKFQGRAAHMAVAKRVAALQAKTSNGDFEGKNGVALANTDAELAAVVGSLVPTYTQAQPAQCSAVGEPLPAVMDVDTLVKSPTQEGIKQESVEDEVVFSDTTKLESAMQDTVEEEHSRTIKREPTPEATLLGSPSLVFVGLPVEMDASSDGTSVPDQAGVMCTA